MRFEMMHVVFENKVQFSESDAPDWLTSIKTVPGSTMDDRWFWKSRVLTLKVGESVETEFNIITRIE